MKRRDFLTVAAGAGAGAIASTSSYASAAQDRPKEKELQIYKCKSCGAIVQVLKPGTSTLTHCGQPMELLEAQTEDEGYEKHVPVIEKIDGGYRVKVGSTAHPMNDVHWITHIQLLGDDFVCTKMLGPDDEPEAVFMTEAKDVTARAYCNLHGLWKTS